MLQNSGFNLPPGVNYKQAHGDLHSIDSSMRKSISNLIEIIRHGNVNLLKLFLANDLGYKIKTKGGIRMGKLSDTEVFENILDTDLLCHDKVKMTSIVFERFENSYHKPLFMIAQDYAHCISKPVFRYLLTNISAKTHKLYLYQKVVSVNRFDLAKEIKGLSKHKMNYMLFDYMSKKGVDVKNPKKMKSFISRSSTASFLDKELRLKSRQRNSMSMTKSISRKKKYNSV